MNRLVTILRHIRSSLTTEAAKTIAVAIVGSRLDYCNSLLAGTSTSNLACLQMFQNTLARVNAQKSRYYHITPVLAGLHRLSVCQRINFKIATTAFKVLHHHQPLYRAQILPRYNTIQYNWHLATRLNKTNVLHEGESIHNNYIYIEWK